MNDTILTINIPATPISVAALLPQALFTTLLILLVICFVGAEQDAMSMFPGTWVHKFSHDARHLLGFPCH